MNVSKVSVLNRTSFKSNSAENPQTQKPEESEKKTLSKNQKIALALGGLAVLGTIALLAAKISKNQSIDSKDTQAASGALDKTISSTTAAQEEAAQKSQEEIASKTQEIVEAAIEETQEAAQKTTVQIVSAKKAAQEAAEEAVEISQEASEKLAEEIEETASEKLGAELTQTKAPEAAAQEIQTTAEETQKAAQEISLPNKTAEVQTVLSEAEKAQLVEEETKMQNALGDLLSEKQADDMMIDEEEIEEICATFGNPKYLISPENRVPIVIDDQTEYIIYSSGTSGLTSGGHWIVFETPIDWSAAVDMNKISFEDVTEKLIKNNLPNEKITLSQQAQQEIAAAPHEEITIIEEPIPLSFDSYLGYDEMEEFYNTVYV